MNTRELILAAMSANGQKQYSPVQIQKLFFLIDQKIPEDTDGPHFSFEPYDYGPFDKSIYTYLELLEAEGKIEFSGNPHVRWRQYRVTEEGEEEGSGILEQLNVKTAKYISELSDFVRRLSFSQLVSAIYKEFPEMKENSVFRN